MDGHFRLSRYEYSFYNSAKVRNSHSDTLILKVRYIYLNDFYRPCRNCFGYSTVISVLNNYISVLLYFDPNIYFYSLSDSLSQFYLLYLEFIPTLGLVFGSSYKYLLPRLNGHFHDTPFGPM